MKSVLFTFFAIVSQVALAQSQWKPPTNVKQYCLELETSMMRVNRNVVDLNTKAMETNEQSERVALLDQSGNLEKYMIGRQSEWQKLGCAQIIYGK